MMKPRTPIPADDNKKRLVKILGLGFAIVVAGAFMTYIGRPPNIADTTPVCTSFAQRDCLRSLNVEVVKVQGAVSVDRNRYDFEPRDEAMDLTVRMPDQSLQQVYVSDGEAETRVAQTITVQVLNGTIVTVTIPSTGKVVPANQPPMSVIMQIGMVLIVFGSVLFVDSEWQIRAYDNVRRKGNIPSLRFTLSWSIATTLAVIGTAYLWATFLTIDKGHVWIFGPAIVGIMLQIVCFKRINRIIAAR